MGSIIDTLVTDRTRADVLARNEKGTYNAADLNRVDQAVAYLTGRLEELGYRVASGEIVPAYYIRLSVDPAGGGLAAGGGTLYQGERAVLTARPTDKYDFVGWMEGGKLVSTNADYRFTVERTRRLTAMFARKTYRIGTTVQPSGSGEATGAGTYEVDTVATIAAKAGDGYAFTGWTEGGETVSSSPGYSFPVERDRTFVAVMVKTYAISVGVGGNDGGIAAGGGTFRQGETVTVTAQAREGFVFTGWTEGGETVSTDEIYTFPAGADRRLTAVFVRVYEVALSVVPEGGGSAQGGGTYREGEQLVVTAAPGGDYRFVAWEEAGAVVSTAARYAFQVDGARMLTAVFELIPVYTITASVGPDGGGTVTGAGRYKEGAVVIVRAAPEDGYEFTGWQVDGQAVSAAAEYTFTAVKDVVLVAVFEAKPPRLPEGYTEVEYISWTYSMTGFDLLETIDCTTDALYFKFKPTAYGASNSLYSYLIANNGITSRSLAIVLESSSSDKLNYCLGTTQTSTISMATKDVLLEFSLDFRAKKHSVNGKTLAGYNPTTPIGTGTKRIGWGTWINIQNYSCPGEFYALSQYRNGELIRDYVPCVAPDGTAGICEAVSGTFIKPGITNAVITAGPAV